MKKPHLSDRKRQPAPTADVGPDPGPNRKPPVTLSGRKTTLGCCLLLMTMLVPSMADDEQEAQPKQPDSRFFVKLTDGTSILCKPMLATMPVKTSYADMAIPFHRIRKVTIEPKDRTVLAKFMNGDILRGACSLESIEVETVIGKLTIPMKHVTEIVNTEEEKPPPRVYSDSPDRRAQCINILRQIDSAKEQFALANRLGDGAIVQGPPIGDYIKGGWAAVRCPAGGEYKINPIAQKPECSVPGHAL